MQLINTIKIKKRMTELHLTQKDVAFLLEIAQPTANQKINNIRPMRLDEAEKLSKLLKISNDEFKEYFFCEKSCITQH